MKLKELREKSGYNQTKIAEQIGIPRINYNKYETGGITPPLTELIKIADYYGVSLDYLCDHETPNQIQLGYMDEKSKAIMQLVQQLTDKNKDSAYYYLAGLVAGQ